MKGHSALHAILPFQEYRLDRGAILCQLVFIFVIPRSSHLYAGSPSAAHHDDFYRGSADGMEAANLDK